MRHASRVGTQSPTDQRSERSDLPPTTDEVVLPSGEPPPATERIREALLRWLDEEM
jgi:hypothetical protein